MSRGARLCLLLALVGAAPACGKFRKSRECGELAGAVNAFIGETTKAVPTE